MFKSKAKSISKMSDTNSSLLTREFDKNILNIRQSDNIKAINRMNIERDQLTSYNSNNINYNNNNNNIIGEITGDLLNDTNDTFNKGMPVRSQFTIKKPLHDSNAYTDFNIFNDDGYVNTKTNIVNYDPSNNNFETQADILTSMTKLSTQLEPIQICSNGIEKLLIYLFKTMCNLNIDKFVINAFGLYILFGGLYLSSKNTTEINLKQFFVYPKKTYVYEALTELYNILKNINTIKYHNIVIIGNDVPYNPRYLDNINNFMSILRVNIEPQEIKTETIKINKIISNLIGADNKYKKSVSEANINNLQVMLLNVLIIHPVWVQPFDKIIIEHFNNRKIEYLYSIGSKHLYYDDNKIKLIELKSDKINMGILLHKNPQDISNLDETTIKYYISNLKEVVFDEIKIPIFRHDLKIKYNGILKNEISTIFAKFIAPELFPETTVIHDVIQNISIIIDGKSNNKNKEKNSKNYITNRTFFVNTPFIYYFRIIHTNTIITMGYYE